MRSEHESMLTQFSSIDESRIDQLLEESIKCFPGKIVVLDDDPTGVQTVHGVSVFTDWTKESIKEGLTDDTKLFYILTNSRSFTEEQTKKAHEEIGSRVFRVAKELDIPVLLISRGDSTLRGHYPLETNVLKEQYETVYDDQIDGEIICPFFKEGGRFTIGDIHYVKDKQWLIPAGQTEFAKDKTFPFTSSDLSDYIQEKTNRMYKEEDIFSISLELLRNEEVDKITDILCQVRDFQKVIVNAVDYCDLKVFCICLYRAMARDKKFLFRTAASFVKVIGGIKDKGLLLRDEMISHETPNGGILVIGSHTQKTTKQLEALKDLGQLEFIELNSDLVLNEDELAKEVERVVAQQEVCIESGKTVVVYTKRKLLEVENDTKEQALLRSVRISDAVKDLVGKLSVKPAFVIAKGGITSSDIGTKALQVKKAFVLGQIQPGIPVWRTGPESKMPGIPYVIFPGNVGEDATLRNVLTVFLNETA